MNSIIRSPELASDTFVFVGDEQSFEDLLMYRNHGLHPIVLGDIIPKQYSCMRGETRAPRYRIILKLGHGSFSTVWLAVDLQDNGYVAVKIGMGSDDPSFSEERNLLEELNNIPEEKAVIRRVITLYDSFIIQGPNGFHECLVCEVVVPLSFMADQYATEIANQMLEGFELLHDYNIIHGDPHLGNFGIAVPYLNDYKEEEIIEFFSVPETIPVVSRRLDFPMETVPAYLTGAVSISEFLTNNMGSAQFSDVKVRLIDFGRAARVDSAGPVPPGAAPEMFSPPEVLFNRLVHPTTWMARERWSKEAEVWAIGCLIFKFISRGELIRRFQPIEGKLVQAIELGGPPPQHWASQSPRLTRFMQEAVFPQSQTNVWDGWLSFLNENTILRLQDREIVDFIDMVRQIVVTEPESRARIADIVCHPFFTKR